VGAEENPTKSHEEKNQKFFQKSLSFWNPFTSALFNEKIKREMF